MNRKLSYRKFVFLIITTGFIYILSLVVLKYVFLVNLLLMELLVGWFLSSVNILIGVKILEKALTKSNKGFMITSFSSMFVRMFATLIIFLVLILVFKFDKTSFVFSVFGFYFIYLLFEILYLVSYSRMLKIEKK